MADVLDDHTVFEITSIDRMHLNVWQPRLAYGGGVQGFFVGHRGHHYACTALMDSMTKAFVADIYGFVAARGLDLISFGKGERKDDLAREFEAVNEIVAQKDSSARQYVLRETPYSATRHGRCARMRSWHDAAGLGPHREARAEQTRLRPGPDHRTRASPVWVTTE